MTASPLAWPPGWARTQTPAWSTFKVTQNEAQRGILRELDLLGATNVVISTNLELRRDGQPYSGRREPDDRRTAGSRPLGSQGDGQRGLPGLQGASCRGHNHHHPQSWWQVLGVEPDASRQQVKDAYRDLAQVHHPDQGGSAEQFEAVTRACREGLEVRS